MDYGESSILVIFITLLFTVILYSTFIYHKKMFIVHKEKNILNIISSPLRKKVIILYESILFVILLWLLYEKEWIWSTVYIIFYLFSILNAIRLFTTAFIIHKRYFISYNRIDKEYKIKLADLRYFYIFEDYKSIRVAYNIKSTKPLYTHEEIKEVPYELVAEYIKEMWNHKLNKEMSIIKRK